MSNFQECKNIKEIVQNISYDVCFKISFYSILVYFLIPLLSMFTNIFIKGSSTMYLYVGLFLFGFIGLLNGGIYFFKKYYEGKINSRVLVPIIIILIFFIWSFISSLLSSNKLFSFIGTWYRHDGYISYVFYLGFFIHGFIVSHDKTYLKTLLNILLISSTIMCFLILINNKLTDIFVVGINDFSYNPYTGFAYNTNHFAYYLSLTIVASIGAFLNCTGIKKVFYFFCYVVELVVLIENRTFGSFFAIFITIILLFIYSLLVKKNIIYTLLILISILLSSLVFKNVRDDFNKFYYELFKISTNFSNLSVPFIDDENVNNNSNLIICSGNSRLDLWLKGIELIKNKPIFGYGIENLEKPYFDIVMCDRTDRPHNIFIQLGANIGIMGIVLYVSFLGIIFINLLKKIKYIDPIIMCFAFMSIGYIVSSMFGNSMFYTTPYYMVSLGVIMSVYFFRRDEVNDR